MEIINTSDINGPITVTVKSDIGVTCLNNTPSIRTIMATVLESKWCSFSKWNHNHKAYCKTLQKLELTKRNKIHEILQSGILLHENECFHTAWSNVHLIKKFRWNIFGHPRPQFRTHTNYIHCVLSLKQCLNLITLNFLVFQLQCLNQWPAGFDI